MVPPDSTGVSRVPAYSGTPATRLIAFRVRDFHPLRSDIPVAFRYAFSSFGQSPSTTRMFNPSRFGLFPFRSPLLRESLLISLPPGTEMFQFPGLAPALARRVTGLASGRVSPFGHPGITASVQLPQAYRSLPRPSSPLDAKASTVCLIAFDLKFV